MKAKFNREAYAKSIQVSEDENKQGADNLQIHKFQEADYSFHIKETAGKVLSCSEVWHKEQIEKEKEGIEDAIKTSILRNKIDEKIR